MFRARAVGGDDVALKLIHPNRAFDSQFRRMFAAEAKLGLLLDHPNVVKVVDFGEVDGTLFLALELVEGAALSAMLESSDLPQEAGFFVIDQIAKALDYVHEGIQQGTKSVTVVHRDVSPSNILISRSGSVKLSDFGVVRLPGHTMTQTSELKGKPRYIAPEQFLGGARSVDPRADVFSLGVVAHRVLLGSYPFANVEEWLRQGAILHTSGPIGAIVRPRTGGSA